MPVLNAAAFLGPALDALSRQETDLSWELIVSDNGSTDNSVEIAQGYREKVPSMQTVDASDIPGAAHARNTGAAYAKAPLLLFCDSDDRVEPCWLNEMARVLHNSPLVGGPLTPMQLGDTGPMGDSLQGAALPNIRSKPYVASANLGCTKWVFDALNGFDEQFDAASGEDVDFSLRARSLGITPSFVPLAVVHYRYRTGLAAAMSQAWDYGMTHPILLEKHGFPMPTVVDDLRILRGLGKQTVRDVLRGRGLSAALVSAAYFAGEASVLLTKRSFWRMSSTYTQ